MQDFDGSYKIEFYGMYQRAISVSGPYLIDNNFFLFFCPNEKGDTKASMFAKERFCCASFHQCIKIPSTNLVGFFP